MSQNIPVVHMIGQAHLDPVWLWPLSEGRAEALATCASAIAMLKEYPDFHFTRGEAQVYRWLASEAPEMLEEIRRFVAEGRWHVVNGMVLQPDMNLPMGESFVRQALLGKRTLQETLGVDVPVAYCVDSFGHAGTLPQILRKCGFDHYCFMRPQPHEKDLPSQTFWWEGPDGSRILTHRIPSPYCTRMEEHEEHIAKALDAKPGELAHTMSFFGVGNHGGGPTREQIENIQAMGERREDVDICFSHPQAYFDAIAGQADALPVVRDELQQHAVGCYSVVSELKRIHRQAEGALLVAERMVCLANQWAGQPIPLDELRDLWWETLLNQFHDTLGGSSIKRGEDEAIMAFGRVVLGARALSEDAGRAVAQEIDTSGPGGTFVIFNPFAHRVVQHTEYEPWTGWQPWDEGAWGLVDEMGKPVPHQLIEPDTGANRATHGISRLVFPVDVPPMGYRLFRFASGLPCREVSGGVQVSGETLENEHWRLRLDPKSGNIVSCVERPSGIELVGPEGWNLPLVLADETDTWSHDVTHFDQVIGQFGDAQIIVCDEGPLQGSLLIERSYEGNTWSQQIILRRGEPLILIRNWIVWQGRWRMLKLAFQVPTDHPQAFHDAPFGWLERPCDGREVPTQMWMDVTGPLRQKPEQQVGLAVLNDGKYGCDVWDSTLRLTVLRCPPYAFHNPHEIGDKHRYDWVDQGYQEFTVALLPHLGDWRESDLIQQARGLNLPLVPITMHAHPGQLPTSDSLMRLEGDELELTALKPAEDGEGFVVRVADKHGRGGEGTLVWQGRSFGISLQPFEVSTWRWREEDDRWQLTPCDMIERPLERKSSPQSADSVI